MILISGSGTSQRVKTLLDRGEVDDRETGVEDTEGGDDEWGVVERATRRLSARVRVSFLVSCLVSFLHRDQLRGRPY